MSSFLKRPAPSDHAAVEKVFEMARELTGCLMPAEQEEWLAWLASVRAFMRSRTVRGDCERCGVVDVMVRSVLLAVVPMSDGSLQHVIQNRCESCAGPVPTSGRRCTTCGGVGHNKTTCALNVEHIDVEPA